MWIRLSVTDSVSEWWKKWRLVSSDVCGGPRRSGFRHFAMSADLKRRSSVSQVSHCDWRPQPVLTIDMIGRCSSGNICLVKRLSAMCEYPQERIHLRVLCCHFRNARVIKGSWRELPTGRWRRPSLPGNPSAHVPSGLLRSSALRLRGIGSCRRRHLRKSFPRP